NVVDIDAPRGARGGQDERRPPGQVVAGRPVDEDLVVLRPARPELARRVLGDDQRLDLEVVDLDGEAGIERVLLRARIVAEAIEEARNAGNRGPFDPVVRSHVELDSVPENIG